jgi:hypothetical protein
MQKPADLGWAEVSAAARDLFHIWTDHLEDELIWAKSAWTALQQAGLTMYSGDVQRSLVQVRLMTLAAMYHEFAELAWQEDFEPAYIYWAEELGISEIRVGQLLGPDELQEDDNGLFETGLQILVNRTRNENHKALVAHFGSDSDIFASMWRVLEPEEDNYFILNEVTLEKMAAFQWIGQGMTELH